MTADRLDAAPDGRDAGSQETTTRPGAARPPAPSAPQPRAAGAGAQLARKKSRRKKRRVLPLLVLAAAAVTIGWWWWSSSRSERQAADPAALTAVVERRDFSSSVLATGAVQAQVGAEVRVGARISGKVSRLCANIGDRVTRGQVIAELEKADLEALLAQRDAELQLAKAKLAAGERLLPMEVDRARLELARWQATQSLYEQEITRERLLLEADAASQQALEQAEERLAVARAQVASAENELELAEARREEELRQAASEVARAQSALANAQVQLSYATITAPIDGVIASVSTQEGETVAAGLNAPTFVTIIDLDRLQVDAYVDEVDIGKIRPGQDALFTVDTFPGREFKGRVNTIYPKAVIQDNVVNYDVVIDILDRHEGALRPEMTASVTVLLEARLGVLAIPSRAVKRVRGASVVYIAGGGEPEMREVKVGWKDGPWIEVLEGLDDGEIVFIDPPAEIVR